MPASPHAPTQLPTIDGSWDHDDAGAPHLIGSKCPQCGTYVFPPRAIDCPDPACAGDVLEAVALSRRGKVWSYTEASKSFAEKHLGPVERVPSVRAVSLQSPQNPQHLPELPDIATDSTAVAPGPERVFKDQILDAAYAEAGIGPEDLSLAEVYDLSTALELDWHEHLGLCAKGEAEQLLRSGATTIGGRVPVNASGGLASFGEAIPAQAIAQVEGATVGLTANQGLFGHGSSVVVAR